jgi:hypothetical protein
MIRVGHRARHALVIALTIAAVFANLVAPALAQAPVDPQSLVGEWSGQWQWKSNAKHTGPYFLTIEKVEGNNVFGNGQIRGSTNTEFKFRGKLEGNRLTFGGSPNTDLVIDGTEMSGSVSGGRNPLELKLNKRK